MPQMTGKLSQMLKLSKEDPKISTLAKAMTGPYKVDFIQDMTQEFKELEHHGTWTIVSRKSVTGYHILPSTWDFKVKRFPDGRLQKFKARFCARGDRQVEGIY